MTVGEQFAQNPLLAPIYRGFADSPETDEESAFISWFLEIPVRTGYFEFNCKLRNMFQVDQSLLEDNVIASPLGPMIKAYGGALAAEMHRLFSKYMGHPLVYLIQRSPPRIKDLGADPTTNPLIRNILFEWTFDVAGGQSLATGKQE